MIGEIGLHALVYMCVYQLSFQLPEQEMDTTCTHADLYAD